MIHLPLLSPLLRAVQPAPRPPDFFFVGHPRSGSGLLDSYLSGHPDIFMARKELHYFGSDLGYHDPPRSLDNYLDHFRGAGEARRVGEASTWYLASARAADEIRAFCAANETSEPRILLMLRDPVSWLHSLHSHLVFTGDEREADFEAALAAEADRAAGRRTEPWCIPAVALRYRHHTAYAQQVARYFDAFGRDRVKVVINDEFRADSERVYDDVLSFLDLPVDFAGKDEVISASKRSRNSNRSVKSAALRDFVFSPPRRRVLEGVDPAPVPGVGLAIRALRRANIVYAPREPMSDDLRGRLRADLRPEVERLEALLDRDLSSWKR